MLHATREELRKSFFRHILACEKAPSMTHSHRMLLCYAVECGLKVCIMKEHPILMSTRDFGKIADCEKLMTHNLNYLLDRAHCGAMRLSPVKLSDKYVGGRNQRAGVEELHEIFRYGINADALEIDRAMEILGRIINWLKERLA